MFSGSRLGSPVTLLITGKGIPGPALTAPTLGRRPSLPGSGDGFVPAGSNEYVYSVGQVAAGNLVSIQYSIAGHQLSGDRVAVSIRGDAIGAGLFSQNGAGPFTSLDGLVPAGSEVGLVTFTVPDGTEGVTAYSGSVVYTGGGLPVPLVLTFEITAVGNVDGNANGLIDISTIEQLNNIRFNLAGTSYKTAADALGVVAGCPTGICHGYELLGDLDFTAAANYAAGEVNLAYLPLDKVDPLDADAIRQLDARNGVNPGFTPLGYYGGLEDADSELFTCAFEGNGYAIRNLYINLSDESTAQAALFGAVSKLADISNLGIRSAYVSGGALTAGLVGLVVDGGTVHTFMLRQCYFSGRLFGSGSVGSLVGTIGGVGGLITDCYARGTVRSEGDAGSVTGGIVGQVTGGLTLRNSYATSLVYADGSAGGLIGSVAEGGLVLVQNSYASASVEGQQAGGLVGRSVANLAVLNTYASGSVSAAAGGIGGGLIGAVGSSGTILVQNSYADNQVGSLTGGLIGSAEAGANIGVIRSYWNVLSAKQSAGGGIAYTADLLYGLSSAGAGGWSENDWDFGTDAELPALRLYATDRTGGQVQGELLCDQGVPRAQCRPTLGLDLVTSSSASRAQRDFTAVTPFRYAYDAGELVAGERGTFTYTVAGSRLAVSSVSLEQDASSTGIFSVSAAGPFTPTDGGIASADTETEVSFTIPTGLLATTNYTLTCRYTGGGLAEPVVLLVRLRGLVTPTDATLLPVVTSPSLSIDAASAFALPAALHYRYDIGSVSFGSTGSFDYTLNGYGLGGDVEARAVGIGLGTGFAFTGSDAFTPTGGGVPAGSSSGSVTFSPTNSARAAVYTATITYTGGGLALPVVVELTARGLPTPRTEVDADGDGLIELYTIEDLRNAGYNPSGTSYRQYVLDEGATGGCPGGVCRGYELANDLDFNNPNSYATGEVFAPYVPVDVSGARATQLSLAQNEGFEGIGNATRPFTGVFEGNGFTIRNLYTRSAEDAGLFRVVSFGAVIENVSLTDAYVSSTSSTSGAGILIGSTGPEVLDTGVIIQNVSVAGGVAGLRGVGGIIGRGALVIRIRNSSAAVEAVGSATFGGSIFVGGLVGEYSASGDRRFWISNSHATGQVEIIGEALVGQAGGLVGGGGSLGVLNSYATVTVSVSADAGAAGGGLIGSTSDNALLSNCYATGEVVTISTRGAGAAGGLIGEVRGGVSDRGDGYGNCYASGDVRGDNAGGLIGIIVGADAGLDLLESYATGAVVGGTFAGGLIGSGRGTGNIRNCYWDTVTSGQTDAIGSLAGVSEVGLTGYTTAGLQHLSGVALEWSENSWHFGTKDQYPALRTYEQENDRQLRGRLFCSQPGLRAQCAPLLELEVAEASTSEGAGRAFTQTGNTYAYTLGRVQSGQTQTFTYAIRGTELSNVQVQVVETETGGADVFTRDGGDVISPILESSAAFTGTFSIEQQLVTLTCSPPAGLTSEQAYSVRIAYREGGLDEEVVLTVSVIATVNALVDADGDGLIDIRTIEALNNVRYNLAGTSYRTSALDYGSTGGCPEGNCVGYELLNDLNFADAS
ncbi:MAG: hypothetical protein K0U66_01870, partial [Gammaproteobacteria bacterium]|nr:hypothetical protein [Gammaproteobacteria bacterium]